MFYIICDGQVVDTSDKRPSWKELKQWANDLNAEAYVIRGEHAGMSAEPDVADEDVNPDLADSVKRTVSFAEDWFRNARAE